MPKDFYRLLVIIVTVNSGIFLIAPLLPNLLIEHGFSITELSLPFALLILTRIMTKPLVCYFLAVFSPRSLLVSVSLLQIVVFFGYTYWSSKASFLWLRVLEGFIEGTAVFIVTDALVVLSRAQANQGLMMGLFSAAFSLGFLIGPLLLMVTDIFFGMKHVFLAGILLSISGLLASIWFSTPLTQANKTTPRFFWCICIEAREYLPFFAPHIIRRVLSLSFMILLPLTLVQDIGLEEKYVGYFFALSGLIVIALMPFMGRLSDKYQSILLTLIGVTGMSICLILFGLVSDLLLFTVVFIIETFAFCLMLPAATKIFSRKIVDYPDRSIAIGAFSSLVDFISLLIALSFPYLYSLHHALPWGILGVTGLLSTFPYTKSSVMVVETRN